MLRHLKTATLAFIALAGAASLALAQAPAPGASTPPAPAATPVPAAPADTAAKKKGTAPPTTATTPEGIQCSAEADQKGLKGKERRAFRRKCIADIKKAANPKAEPKAAPKAAEPAKKG